MTHFMRILFLAVSVFLFALPALADDQRAVDMTAVLHDGNGRVLKDFSEQAQGDQACEKCPALTVGRAVDHALKARFPDEQNLPGEQSWARALLGDRVKADKAARLTLKEAETIERLVMKAYTGEVIAQIVPMLDPNRKPPELQ